MTRPEPNEMVLALEDVLERERTALITGDLEMISRMVDSKNSIINRLNDDMTLDHGSLRTVQSKLERNQALLNSAKDGIRYVADRIKAMKEASEKFETYDRNGYRMNVRMRRNPNVERRS